MTTEAKDAQTRSRWGWVARLLAFIVSLALLTGGVIWRNEASRCDAACDAWWQQPSVVSTVVVLPLVLVTAVVLEAAMSGAVRRAGQHGK